MKSSKGICDERGCESPARNEKGPAKGLFPQCGDLHNIVIIVNYWNLFFGCGERNSGSPFGGAGTRSVTERALIAALHVVQSPLPSPGSLRSPNSPRGGG